MFSTSFCIYRDFETSWYRRWSRDLGFIDKIQRKSWELSVIAETLDSHGALEHGKKGVGFGCGSEPIAMHFADRSGQILATDLLKSEWQDTHHGFGELSRHPGIETRCVDMNWIDGQSGVGSVESEQYDFSWSCCSMDHCGSVWLTKRFLLNQMNCLKAEGIAVHTGEYTISLGLPRSGNTVWLDWSDIIDIESLSSQLGYELAPINWNIGDSVEDHKVDPHPYPGPVHLKPEIHAGRWGTCVAFAVRKRIPGVFWVPLDENEARASIVQRSHSQT